MYICIYNTIIHNTIMHIYDIYIIILVSSPYLQSSLYIPLFYIPILCVHH